MWLCPSRTARGHGLTVNRHSVHSKAQSAAQLSANSQSSQPDGRSDTGVYDVTEFAPHHPGGPYIGMANGGPTEYVAQKEQ